tara:strand:- start:268 stop:531 length:264 start_codon:yes stop_codon:yes gene_type:complete
MFYVDKPQKNNLLKLQLIIEKYIRSLIGIDLECKYFLIRQINRMPDYYHFGVKIICFLFYVLRLNPKKLNLLNKLFSSLTIIKNYES